MSFKVKQTGGSITFTLEWAYPEYLGHYGDKYRRFYPTDVHVDVEVEGKGGKWEWKPLIGYDTIPDSINPGKPFKLDVGLGNPLLAGHGRKCFRVRWSYWGHDEHIDWPKCIDLKAG